MRTRYYPRKDYNGESPCIPPLAMADLLIRINNKTPRYGLGRAEDGICLSESSQFIREWVQSPTVNMIPSNIEELLARNPNPCRNEAPSKPFAYTPPYLPPKHN